MSAPCLLWSNPRIQKLVLILQLLVESLRVPKWLKNGFLGWFKDSFDRLNLRLILLDHVQDALFSRCARLLYVFKLQLVTGYLCDKLIIILLGTFDHTNTCCCKTCVLSLLELCTLICFTSGHSTINSWNRQSAVAFDCGFDFRGPSLCWALARSSLRARGFWEAIFLLDWAVVVVVWPLSSLLLRHNCLLERIHADE